MQGYEMEKDICRAITFINYHIPPVLNAGKRPPYVTVGFFDGMLTERLDVCYEEKELKDLWKYSIKRTDAQLGQYSYQNIFCFSRDEWNLQTDDQFWKEETDQIYPLTFVVFLQLRDYREGDRAIESQCRKFDGAASISMGDGGICYTYNTIDKNDFVVCLKCRKYETAVNAIKSLHQTGVEIIYSYSVFSVSRMVLAELENERYRPIFEENIFSICLKGITNSYDLRGKVTLDQKYYEFCEKLVDRLYPEKEDVDYKIYDILGDDDFRLIARNVNLGRLLQQFAPGGLLCYEEDSFRFYLFSSGMVLNTLTPENQKEIDKGYIKDSSRKMEAEFQSPHCDQLEKKMINISKIISQDEGRVSERVTTFCHALWQLLQSLKPLETAPGKKYDFCSLYIPFSMMTDILEEKLEKACQPKASEKEKDFIGNEEIYTFIHKISMTLHGTLRTDIQFFQIRDFNVIVHYAPAKLRAFYSFWVLQLKDFYSEFNENGIKNEYSFILSPGMYRRIDVRALYTNYDETKRLMLIQVPERHLYAVRWFPVILAHEVSHFVGYASRKRQRRHLACMQACARVLFLEMNHYRYRACRTEQQSLTKKGVKELKLFEKIKEKLKKEEEIVRVEEHVYPHEFHTDNSILIIRKAFRRVNERYTEKKILEDCERMNVFLIKEKNIKEMAIDQQYSAIREIHERSNEEYKELLALNYKFESSLLLQLLKMLIYICKEAYADLIAILTLGLSPEDYILSFSKGELDLDEDRVQEEVGVLLLARAGITIYTLMRTAENAPGCLSERFCKEWSGNVAKRMAKDFGGKSKESVESKLAVDIYGYIEEIRNCNEDISKYKSLYNYAEGYFGNDLLDFLNDQVIWDYLTGYLDECANAYIVILSDEQLKKRQEKLLKTYDRVARENLTSMSQEVENFLAECEAGRMKMD